MTEIRRVALLIDFDNVYGDLAKMDAQIAGRFGLDPKRVLELLTNELLLDGIQRRFLIRRVYLNPGGSVAFSSSGVLKERGSIQEESDTRVYFSEFRAAFVNAGFEVVDCNPVARSLKNAADIRICVDVMSLLSQHSPFDEFVIMSGDSDMTPLVHHLRHVDRATMLVTTMESTEALNNSAERIIYIRELMMRVDLVDETQSTLAEGNGGLGLDVLENPSYAESRKNEFEKYIRAEIEGATSPINIAQLGSDLRPEFGQLITATNYLGKGTLGTYLRSLDLPGWSIQEHHFVKDGMHARTPEVPITLNLSAELLNQLRNLNVPLLSSVIWHALFEAIKEYADTQEFHYNSCAKWIRDESKALSEATDKNLRTPSRAQINFVVTGCGRGGLPMQAAKGKEIIEFSDAFVKSLMRSIEFSPSLEIEQVRESLNNWIA